MDSNPGGAQSPVRQGGLGLKLGLVAASMAVGAIGATAIAAGAATTSPTAPSASASASPTAPNSQAPNSEAPNSQAPNSQTPNSQAPGERGGEGECRGGRGGGRGPAPARGDEQAVTGAQAEALKAAALKAVPGGTVYRVETDAGDAAFEVHMTKADGAEVTVKFDENLAVIEVQEGMGKGDPKPADDQTDDQTDD
jgi:hypothetical protein